MKSLMAFVLTLAMILSLAASDTDEPETLRVGTLDSTDTL